MTSAPRRYRALKVVAVLLAVPFLGIGAACLWVHRVADRRWADAESRIQQLRAAYPPEDPRPSSSSVSETSKDIQAHLVGAIREAVRCKGRQGGELSDSILEEAQEFLDRLHLGGRLCAAAPSDFPPRWRGDWDHVTLTFMMNCSVVRARQHRERRAPIDAVETLLDSLQLARFWAASGSGINRIQSLASLPPALDELRDILSREDLSTDQFRGIERELKPLDEALESPLRDLEPVLARWGDELRGWDSTDLTAIRAESYRWRILPERLMRAEAFEWSDRHVRRLLECGGLPYPELQRRLQQMEEEKRTSSNPIIREHTIFNGKLGWFELDRKADIRLLRAAARYRATGEILSLPDPFGTSLLHSQTETRIKFWTVGDDGRDDGGDGGTTGRWGWLRPEGSERPARDRVIEVPRRSE